MLKNYPLAFLLFFAVNSYSQITINSADLPSGGDHVLTSVAATAGMADLTITGPNATWDFSSLVPTFQRYEIFDAAGSYTGYYNALYNPFTGIPTSYGKVNFTASLIPIPGLSITSAYDFFKKSSSNLKQVGLAYTLNDSLPLPFEYNMPDVVYNFPVSYLNTDSCDFQYKPHHLIPSGTLPFYYGGTGKRINEVDGWGTLITPFGSFQTLRIKSIVMQTDTLFLDSTIGGFSTPRPTRIEYKWLAAGKKVPVLQIDENIVLGAPVVTNVTYLDSLRSTVPYVGITETKAGTEINVFPNPANENVTLEFDLPSNTVMNIRLLNMLGQKVADIEKEILVGQKQSLNVNLQTIGLKPGIYFISFEANSINEVKKLVVQ